jgi:hypothetical protein
MAIASVDNPTEMYGLGQMEMVEPLPETVETILELASD